MAALAGATHASEAFLVSLCSCKRVVVLLEKRLLLAEQNVRGETQILYISRVVTVVSHTSYAISRN